MGEDTRLDRLPAQHNEVLCSLHHESGELVAQNAFYFIGLFYLDAEADRVDRGFDEDALILIPGDGQRIK